MADFGYAIDVPKNNPCEWLRRLLLRLHMLGTAAHSDSQFMFLNNLNISIKFIYLPPIHGSQEMIRNRLTQFDHYSQSGSKHTHCHMIFFFHDLSFCTF